MNLNDIVRNRNSENLILCEKKLSIHMKNNFN